MNRRHVRPVAVPGTAPRPVTGGDAPNIDWRASRLRAYGLAPELVCSGCGCVLEAVPFHSPRCKA